MIRLSTAVIAVAAVGSLTLADRAVAQTARPKVENTISSTAGAPLSLEEAARLTWRLETRGDGIAALRVLVAEAPDDVNARFELGRVLTWDMRTRAEGVTLLADVLQQQPGRSDAQEAFAEVLSWDTGTRPESIERLRALVQREPDRTSARLKLAEVLSWEDATREESRALYKDVLRENPESVEAAVGLARVLSWSGRIPESRAWYELALARNPDAQGARVGIAELEGWHGRSRSSLKNLSLEAGGTIDTPAALRIRAQAYQHIGRPASALDQYKQLLALEPANSTALSASRVLRQDLRPSLEIGGEMSTESGDPASTKVETVAVPFRFAFHPAGRDTQLSVSWAHAAYRNSRGSKPARLLGAGLDTPLGNYVRLRGDVVSHTLEDVSRTFTGSGQLEISAHDSFDIRVGFAREQLLSSRLSLAGEWVDGMFYGASFVNQAFLAAGARASAWDVWAHATAGQIRGTNISDNSRRELFAGGGRSFNAGRVTLRPGYSIAWMSYDLDLAGFPGDVVGDGLTMPGIGGYFSPSQFVNHMARFDVTLPIRDAVVIVGGAAVGRQRVEDAWSRAAAAWTGSSDAAIGIRARAGNRVTLGMQASYQDVASAFNRTAVRATVMFGF